MTRTKSFLSVSDQSIIIDFNLNYCTVREWKQTNTDVTITLFAGKKILPNDLNVEFTDIGVKVKLFGERG